MTHQSNIIKRATAIGLVVAIFGICAGAQAQGSPTRRARATAHQVQWTQGQLNQLARAYAEKNPGWTAPSGMVAATTPADRTWTPEALDGLAAAYAAKNPGWVRPQ